MLENSKKAGVMKPQHIPDISLQKLSTICFHKNNHCVLMSLFTAGLGEFRIRDLNDEINKLLREKRHWEDRILELGGPDYKVMDRNALVLSVKVKLLFYRDCYLF